MEQSSASPATNNAIRRAEQSGNIANQRFARTKGGLEVQHGNWEADKQKVGIVALAKQKSEQTSIAKIVVISRV